jgi:hypothetical protein
MAASCRQSANSSCSRPIHDGRPSHSASWSRARRTAGLAMRRRAGAWCVEAACAERPRTAASSRRDAVTMCAWAEAVRASDYVGKQRRGGGRCAVVAQRRLQCSSNGCRRDKGRGMSTWTRAPLQMESGCPLVSGPGAPPACFGALPVSAPTLEPRTARGETSCLALSCAARWRARKQLRLPGTSAIYRAPRTASFATSGGCTVAVVCAAPVPPLSATSRA